MADRDTATGHFLPGNRIWEARASSGPKPKFETAEALWDAACEYFEWCDDTPLHEAKAFAYEGSVSVENLPRMRAMSLKGLCLFLDVSEEAWRRWKIEGDEIHKPHLVEVMAKIEATIFQWKFEGAAAGLLNAAIIARELGLADKRQLGNDPENPLPASQVTFFALPENGRD